MIELPLVFVAGILGTAHCLGMCGPLALAVGSHSRHMASALARQLVYTTGRLFTYGVLGAAAGYGGQRLAHAAPWIANVPALLAIAAGLLLIYQGLRATGWLPPVSAVLAAARRAWHGNTSTAGEPVRAPVACLAGGMLGQFLRQPKVSGVFLAGVFTGLLPCGLLYGMLALASSTHSVVLGGAMMTVFGLGTAPVMILAGAGGRLLSLATRKWLYSAAAWCLVLTGAVSLARGMSYLSLGGQGPAGCPLCQRAE